eukprot:TRINITY_DN93489_c0_g1_i1.p1 TRINITY_DN93489_c0_g1~~TRINITY_DN93489_c0_g1_i1.p1  ORF type:complete len:301 (-),score=41.61 TRINITY_DN93489_c0_g1_i1:134-1012(-)
MSGAHSSSDALLVPQVAESSPGTCTSTTGLLQGEASPSQWQARAEDSFFLPTVPPPAPPPLDEESVPSSSRSQGRLTIRERLLLSGRQSAPTIQAPAESRSSSRAEKGQLAKALVAAAREDVSSDSSRSSSRSRSVASDDRGSGERTPLAGSRVGSRATLSSRSRPSPGPSSRSVVPGPRAPPAPAASSRNSSKWQDMEDDLCRALEDNMDNDGPTIGGLGGFSMYRSPGPASSSRSRPHSARATRSRSAGTPRSRTDAESRSGSPASKSSHASRRSRGSAMSSKIGGMSSV